MKQDRTKVLACLAAMLLFPAGFALAATVVPNEIQQPGTQPSEVALEGPNKCDNCHGGYNQAVEPAYNWRGSMMANAGRDPIFWATLAIAEQDFDGSGDLCIRCHSTGGWYAGRSTPTDGSGLAAGDSNGVDCDTCHKMTRPDNTEHLGVMNAPFLANDEQTPATAYFGSGMLSIWGAADKLGPYADAAATHQFRQSQFHRSVDFCGSCHDVSNPAVGDLAHNNGKQSTGDAVVASGVPGSSVGGKAAFNNFPYKYGVVERTFSEYKAGQLSQTLVSSYSSLPTDLKAGAIQAAYNAAIVAGTGGNYKDGAPRYFSCQTCHLKAVTGQGCNKNPPVREDLPLHDMTGGGHWAPDAVLYQNTQSTLRLGGGMTTVQINATNAGKARAIQQLQLAASLSVTGNTLRVVNLTGHKLISGYPEGRRMWINTKWYGAASNLLREDGAYGNLTVSGVPGAPAQVKTILDLSDPNTRIYEAHYAMTQEWANQLLGLGYSPSLALSYDRVTGAVDHTLGNLAAQSPGTYHETFHFVLNNHVAKDNRIPPYGMKREEARKRNALPVPATQYGNPDPNDPNAPYNYWDEFALTPPPGAVSATIQLLYQSTSWEYIQFLVKANNGSNAFLANEGTNLLAAWVNTAMAEPVVMASTTWTGSTTPAATSTVSGTATGTATTTHTPVPVSTSTQTPTDTATRTATATATESPSRTPTATDTPSATNSTTGTSTFTRTPTDTATHTDTPSSTPTDTATWTATFTDTPVDTATATPTATGTATSTATLADTPTGTPTLTPTPSATPTIFVGGELLYYNGAGPVANVTVDGKASAGGPVVLSVLSDAAGAFVMGGVPGGPWVVEPHLTDSPESISRGVSSLDATRIQEHMVGSRTFTDRQALAGDATGNGALSSLDATRIQELRAGLRTRLPVAVNCNSDWAFVPVPGAQGNPAPVPPLLGPLTACRMGRIEYANLIGSADGQDFEAVLFGDTTGNWTPPAAGGGSSEAVPVAWAGESFPAEPVPAGSVAILPEPPHCDGPCAAVLAGGGGFFVAVNHLARVQGFDLALATPPGVEVIGVSKAPLVAGEGRCSLVWNVANGEVRISLACLDAIDGGGALLSLSVRGEAEGGEAMRVSKCLLDEGESPCEAR